MSSNRTLILHAGGGKTGSSALQNFLASRLQELARLGFSYANSEVSSHAFEITSGNGTALIEALTAQCPSPGAVDQCLGYYFSDLDRAIVSSEFFEYLQEKSWRLLVERCGALGIRLEIVFFVRNVASFFASGYDQVVKRHGESRSIDVWIKSFSWLHYETLRRLSTLPENVPVRVFSYDAEREHLGRCFLNAIGVDFKAFTTKVRLENQVNRSLTAPERDCLRMVNRIFGDTYSQELSDRFIYSHPNVKTEPEVLSDETVEFLENKYRSAVDWINTTYFDERPVVAVFAGEISRPNQKANGVKLESEVRRIFGQWLVEKLSGSHRAIMETVCSRLRNIDWELAGNPLVPEDFDPFAYLLKNPDLIDAGARPYEHYIACGRDEGRGYSWTS